MKEAFSGSLHDNECYLGDSDGEVWLFFLNMSWPLGLEQLLKFLMDNECLDLSAEWIV